MKIPNLRRNLFFAAAVIAASVPIWASKLAADIVADRFEIKKLLQVTSADDNGRSLVFQKQDKETMDKMAEEIHNLLQEQAEQSGYSNLALYYASTFATIGSLLAALISHEKAT